MTETATAEELVAKLTAALDEEEAAAKAATPGPWRAHDTHLPNGAGHTATVLSGEGNATDLRAWLPTMSSKPWDKTRNAWNDADFIARQDPARTLQRVRAHRDLAAAILSEPHHDWRGVSACRKAAYAEEECNCGRDARVGRLLEIIAGIYEEPQP